MSERSRLWLVVDTEEEIVAVVGGVMEQLKVSQLRFQIAHYYHGNHCFDSYTTFSEVLHFSSETSLLSIGGCCLILDNFCRL